MPWVCSRFFNYCTAYSSKGMPIEKSSERPTNNTNATQDERLAALALSGVQAELDVDPPDTGMSF